MFQLKLALLVNAPNSQKASTCWCKELPLWTPSGKTWQAMNIWETPFVWWSHPWRTCNWANVAFSFGQPKVANCINLGYLWPNIFQPFQEVGYPWLSFSSNIFNLSAVFLAPNEWGATWPSWELKVLHSAVSQSVAIHAVMAATNNSKKTFFPWPGT